MGAYIQEGWSSAQGGDGWLPIQFADLTTFAARDLTTLTQDAVTVIEDLALYVNNLGVSGSADITPDEGLVAVGLDDTARIAVNADTMIAGWGPEDEYECTFHVETYSLTGDSTNGGFLIQAITAGDYTNTNCGGYIHDSSSAYRYGTNEDGNRDQRGTNPLWTESAGPWLKVRVGPYGVLFWAGATRETMAFVGKASADLTNARATGAWSNSDAPRLFLFLPVNCTTASMKISSIELRHRPAG